MLARVEFKGKGNAICQSSVFAGGGTNPPHAHLIQQYIAEGNNPDQPGRLVQWLYPRTPFYTWKVPGLWFDVGSKETLEEANRIFAGIA
jgi:hypothetical protein